MAAMMVMLTAVNIPLRWLGLGEDLFAYFKKTDQAA
jgi:hypothetical protein